MQVLNGQSKPPAKPFGSTSPKGKRNRSSVRETLSQALQLKDLAFQVGQELKEPMLSDDDGQKARARAQSVSAVCKSFADMVTIIRIERGKPLPGSLRPESKPKKQKQASWAMVELVPKPKQLPPAPDSTPPAV